MTCIHKEQIARLSREGLRDRRIILIEGTIDEARCNEVLRSMLELYFDAPAEPLHLYINSLGGNVVAAFTIRDTIDYMKAPVYTYCIEEAGEVAGLILARGRKPFRHACEGSGLLLARITSEKASWWANRALARTERTVALCLSTDTAQPFDQILHDLRNARTFDAHAALEYGLVDQVVE